MLLASTSRPSKRVARELSQQHRGAEVVVADVVGDVERCRARGPTIAAWWQTASTPRSARATALGSRHVAPDELGLGVEVIRWPRVRRREQRVEHAHLVTVGEQRVDDVRADEAGAAG